jgi:hypothetical protein
MSLIFLRLRVFCYPGEGRVRENDGKARPRIGEGRPVLNPQVVKKNINYPLQVMKQFVLFIMLHLDLKLVCSLVR